MSRLKKNYIKEIDEQYIVPASNGTEIIKPLYTNETIEFRAIV